MRSNSIQKTQFPINSRLKSKNNLECICENIALTTAINAIYRKDKVIRNNAARTHIKPPICGAAARQSRINHAPCARTMRYSVFINSAQPRLRPRSALARPLLPHRLVFPELFLLLIFYFRSNIRLRFISWELINYYILLYILIFVGRQMSLDSVIPCRAL